MGSDVAKRSAARRGLDEALPAVAGTLLGAALFISSPAPAYPQAVDPAGKGSAPLHASGAAGHLRELIPSEYAERYGRWKAAFLSVEAGRQLWLKYAANPAFRLTVIVSKSRGRGGQVSDYQWSQGRLVAATITLGHRLDRGYPCQLYYPVLGSLQLVRAGEGGTGDDVLAAAKIAHEFGHVEQAANSDAAAYQAQKVLAQAYVSHWQSNGRKLDDPVLAELASEMGGTPVTIFTQRERRAENYALRYLIDKLPDKQGRELLRWVQKS